MNTNSKYHLTQNFMIIVVLRTALIMPLFMMYSTLFAQSFLNVYELQNDGSYKIVNDQVRVTASSLQSNTNETQNLKRNEKGLFEVNSDNHDWLLLEVKTVSGDTYERKVLPHYFKTKKIDIEVYIGHSPYLIHENGIIKPYSPVLDEIFIDTDQKHSADLNHFLKENGLSRIKGSIPTYNLTNARYDRQELLKVLLENEKITELAPLYKKTGRNGAKYFSSRIDIMLTSDCTPSQARSIFKTYGITQFEKIDPFGELINYEKCQAFRVRFSKKQMVGYAFLTTLKELITHPKVVVINTPIITYNKID